MLSRETMETLVDQFHSKYHDVTVEHKAGKPAFGKLSMGHHPYYIVKLPHTTNVTRDIVKTIEGFITDAGLDPEYVLWKIENEELIYFGSYKESEKIYL